MVIGLPEQWLGKRHCAVRDGDFRLDLAARLGERPNSELLASGMGRFCGNGGDRIADPVLRQRRFSYRMAHVDWQRRGIRQHRSCDRGDGSRPWWPSNCRQRPLGRPFGDAGGFGHRYRHFHADRDCAGARPALDDPADPLLFGRLHRILARRPADHGAVLCDLHAAVVSAWQFQDRWPGSRADRHSPVFGRVHCRGRSWRAASYSARAERGGQRHRSFLVEDHELDRDAAGAASRHSRARQQLYRIVQGHLAGVDRGAVRSVGTGTCRVRRSGTGRHQRRYLPALPSPE